MEDTILARSREIIPVGLLYSSRGPYAAIGRAAIDGALMALAEINEDESFPFTLKAAIRDPEGVSDRYPTQAEELARLGCRHVIGTITSSSRKDVIPLVERAGALLWYAFPYEGYETSDHVLYLGACPNQHIVPLLDHALPRFGDRPFLVGSNYIWGWEINRIAREIVTAHGAEPVGERYLAVGSTDVDHLIAEVREKRPDFVLSNLIGPSSYAFVKAYAALGAEDPAFAPSVRPILSCNLTEADTDEIGAPGAGLLSTAIYFDSLDLPENHAFKLRARARFGEGRRFSSCFVSVYAAIRMLAEAIRDAGTDDPAAIKAVATGRAFSTPFGRLAIDPKTSHAAHRPHLGRVRADGAIEIIESGAAFIPADPYLVRTRLPADPVHPADPAPAPREATAAPARLRVIT